MRAARGGRFVDDVNSVFSDMPESTSIKTKVQRQKYVIILNLFQDRSVYVMQITGKNYELIFISRRTNFRNENALRIYS